MLPHGEGGIRASPRTRKAVLTGILARITVDFVCFLAQSRHPDGVGECLLSGVKRTLQFQRGMSAFDPKRTFALHDCRRESGMAQQYAASPRTKIF